MDYILPSTNEKVGQERWCWAAFYKDGTTLHQFEETDNGGIFHQISEINQEKLLTFSMANFATGQTIIVNIPIGGQFIHFYRMFKLDVGNANERLVKVYVFGYKTKEKKHFNFILPDDSIIQSDTDNLQLSSIL